MILFLLPTCLIFVEGARYWTGFMEYRGARADRRYYVDILVPIRYFLYSDTELVC